VIIEWWIAMCLNDRVLCVFQSSPKILWSYEVSSYDVCWVWFWGYIQGHDVKHVLYMTGNDLENYFINNSYVAWVNMTM